MTDLPCYLLACKPDNHYHSCVSKCTTAGCKKTKCYGLKYAEKCAQHCGTIMMKREINFGAQMPKNHKCYVPGCIKEYCYKHVKDENLKACKDHKMDNMISKTVVVCTFREIINGKRFNCREPATHKHTTDNITRCFKHSALNEDNPMPKPIKRKASEISQ